MKKIWPFRNRALHSAEKKRFETPQPADDAGDRGPAKYFHGRRRIIEDFEAACRLAVAQNSGTTFLIQGAPGAGKTALLAVCAERAKAAGWHVADIDPSALWDPEELRLALGTRRKPRITGASGQFSLFGFIKAAISSDVHRSTTLSLLAHGRRKTLLVLDEAQQLGQSGAPLNENVGVATNVLGRIHNGRLGRPIMLLAGGLGTSKSAFSSLGISRFANKCTVDLGPLSPEAERAVISDWLIRDGQASGNPSKWIKAIAQEAYGWPQHIMSYVGPALKQLHRDGGNMTSEGLTVVLSEGRALREAYYRDRASGLSRTPLQRIVSVLNASPASDGVLEEDILSALSGTFGDNEARELFDLALHKGILDERDGLYFIPVPSMRDWLTSTYVNP